MHVISKKGWLITIVLFALILVSLLVLRKEKEEILPPEVEVEESNVSVIGQSVEGRSIEAYSFGEGEDHIVFVGGIHGGYEWNSVFLAYRAIDYLEANESSLPSNVRVTIIPALNPDGLYRVVNTVGRFTVEEVLDGDSIRASGRFNANGVDLNRNFDCKWQPESTWKGNPVSAGSAAFSEPEAAAFREFTLAQRPDAVVFWHSQANAVYASECEDGALPSTMNLMEAYSTASGYPAIASFDAYPVSGDAEGWLASINIPAISVELKTHEIIEWDKNLPGMLATIDLYANP